MLEEDAALLGLKLPEIEPAEEQHFEVFKSNIPVIEAFMILDGCAWQFTGMGQLIGLDYQAAKVIWDYAGIKLDAESFRGLMLFSKVVAAELSKKADSHAT